MDLVQEILFTDKYIGDIKDIENIGNGKIANAIKETNKLADIVNYNPETDSIRVAYGSKEKTLMKVGLQSWLIWSEGVLDPEVEFTISTGAEKNINDKLLEFKATNSTQQYITFPVDAREYDYVYLTGYGHRNFGNQNDYPKLGISLSSGGAPTDQVQEMPYDVEQKYTLNLTGYSSIVYVSINVEYRVPTSSVQCGTSALFTEIECV